MAEKDEKKLTPEDVTPEFLLIQYKGTLLKRMAAGDNVASEIEKIARLDEILKTDPDKAREEIENSILTDGQCFTDRRLSR
jgi:hypothetical protein